MDLEYQALFDDDVWQAALDRQEDKSYWASTQGADLAGMTDAEVDAAYERVKHLPMK